MGGIMLLSLWIMYREERRKDVLHVMEMNWLQLMMWQPGSALLGCTFLPGYCHCIACTASAFTISYSNCLSSPSPASKTPVCTTFPFYPFILLPFYTFRRFCNRKTDQSGSCNHIRPLFKLTGKCTMNKIGLEWRSEFLNPFLHVHFMECWHVVIWDVWGGMRKTAAKKRREQQDIRSCFVKDPLQYSLKRTI